MDSGSGLAKFGNRSSSIGHPTRNECRVGTFNLSEQESVLIWPRALIFGRNRVLMGFHVILFLYRSDNGK